MTKVTEFEFTEKDALSIGINLEPMRQRKKEKALIQQTIIHANELDIRFRNDLERVEIYTSHAIIELDRMNTSTYKRYMEDVYTLKEDIIKRVDITNEDTRLWMLSKGIINVGRYAVFKLFQDDIKKELK